MGWKRSTLECERLKIHGNVLLGILLICTIQISSALTDPTDGKDSSSFCFQHFGLVSQVNDSRFSGHTSVAVS